MLTIILLCLKVDTLVYYQDDHFLLSHCQFKHSFLMLLKSTNQFDSYISL